MEHGGKGSNSYEIWTSHSSGNGNKQHLPPPQHASTHHNHQLSKSFLFNSGHQTAKCFYMDNKGKLCAPKHKHCFFLHRPPLHARSQTQTWKVKSVIKQ